MRVFIIVSALLSSALAQYIDPLVGLLAPQQPPNLYTIRGPIYVEPASLQPPLLSSYGPQPGYAVGPAVVSPPIVGNPVMGPAVVGPPIYGQSVVSPSPYNPYVPVQMLYDEQQDEVSPSGRRSNTNVQSGIQQLGQGNMNLQGNIQQVNRRSIRGDHMQSDQLNDDMLTKNPRGSLQDAISASRQMALQDQIARAYQNDQMGRKVTLQDQMRNQLQNDPSLALRQQNLLSDPLLALRQQNALNDPLLNRQNNLQDQLLRNQLLNDPNLAYRQQNAMSDPLLGRQQSALNDLLIRNQLQNDPLSLIRQQAVNDQLRYRNDLELKDQITGLGPLQNDPRTASGRAWNQIQSAGRWSSRRHTPGFQIQGQGLQAQMPSGFQKGYQNDITLFDESRLMSDELNDDASDLTKPLILGDDTSDRNRPLSLSDALSAEMADELAIGFN